MGQEERLGRTEHLDSLQNSGIRSPKPLLRRCPLVQPGLKFRGVLAGSHRSPGDQGMLGGQTPGALVAVAPRRPRLVLVFAVSLPFQTSRSYWRGLATPPPLPGVLKPNGSLSWGLAGEGRV